MLVVGSRPVASPPPATLCEGKVISVAGPPEPDFGKGFGANWFLIQAMRVLSLNIRRKAKRRGVTYSFLFMKANGDQLRELGSLIDSGAIRPVVDRVFPFQSIPEALAYVQEGRAKGKVVVKVRCEALNAGRSSLPVGGCGDFGPITEFRSSAHCRWVPQRVKEA